MDNVNSLTNNKIIETVVTGNVIDINMSFSVNINNYDDDYDGSKSSVEIRGIFDIKLELNAFKDKPNNLIDEFVTNLRANNEDNMNISVFTDHDINGHIYIKEDCKPRRDIFEMIVRSMYKTPDKLKEVLKKYLILLAAANKKEFSGKEIDNLLQFEDNISKEFKKNTNKKLTS